MGMENYSLADIRAATHDNNNGGFGGDNAWFWIVVLFLFCGGWGNGGLGGMNNAATQGALTRAEMEDGFNTQNILRNQEGLENGLSQMGYSNLQQFNATQSAIKEAQFAQQSCCCETNRNIDALRYDTQKQTCEITSAIKAEGDATRALINANTMQMLRDKLADKDRDILARDMQLSQLSQTSTLVSELRPCAKPAYITCSPYQAQQYNGGCGCGVA